MPLMSTCVGRLGSRYSIILDPIRNEVHYGTLGLMCQHLGQLVIGLEDAQGRLFTLPLCKQGERFDVVDQYLTMTAVNYEAHSLALGVTLSVRIVSPFWPRDERASCVPAYLVQCGVAPLQRVRWDAAADDAPRRGTLRFALQLPHADYRPAADALHVHYRTEVLGRIATGEGGLERTVSLSGRNADPVSTAHDMLLPLSGAWRIRDDELAATFDVRDGRVECFPAAMLSYTANRPFERFEEPMRLKYTAHWDSAADVAAFVRDEHPRLLEQAARFDALWTDSSLPAASQDLTSMAFQSYLMNTLWALADDGERQWFSVWEGSCWYNSTVDVTYNEAMFYFACWPELLEMVFEQWSHHANDAETETRRLENHPHQLAGVEPEQFPGRVLEHDM